jgi:hypothetical protein
VIFQVMRMLGPPNVKGTDPKDVKPLKCGKPVVAAVVAILVFIVATSMHGVNPAITPLSILAGLLILGGVFVTGITQSEPKRTHLLELPELPTPWQETQELRRAVQARSSVAVLPPPVQAPPAPAPARPRASTPTVTLPVRTKVRTVTRKELLADADLDARMLRIAQIMMADCPTCTAKKAVFCTFQPGQRVTVLDRERHIVVHDSRVGNALKTHTASVEDVNAQFEGKIPDSVWRHAL